MDPSGPVHWCRLLQNSIFQEKSWPNLINLYHIAIQCHQVCYHFVDFRHFYTFLVLCQHFALSRLTWSSTTANFISWSKCFHTLGSHGLMIVCLNFLKASLRLLSWLHALLMQQLWWNLELNSFTQPQIFSFFFEASWNAALYSIHAFHCKDYVDQKEFLLPYCCPSRSLTRRVSQSKPCTNTNVIYPELDKIMKH